VSARFATKKNWSSYIVIDQNPSAGGVWPFKMDNVSVRSFVVPIVRVFERRGIDGVMWPVRAEPMGNLGHRRGNCQAGYPGRLGRPSVIDQFLAVFAPISTDPDRSRGALVPTA